MIRWLGLSSFILFSHYLVAQCCGGGAHIGGNIFLGTLGKGYLQVNGNYRYSYSQGYMQKDGPSDFSFVQNAYSNHSGLQLGYGITKKVTLDLETGYFINRTQNFEIGPYKFSHTGSGLTSLTLAGRFNIFKLKKSELEWTAGLGLRVPYSSEPLTLNGVELSEDVQPNNGSYGIMFRSFLAKEFHKNEANLFVINSISYNTTNKKDYREGNTYIMTVLYGQELFHDLRGIFHLRNELRDKAMRYGNIVNSSGGYRLVTVFQLAYTFAEKVNVGLLYELPVYRYYYGTQIKDIHAFSLNVNLMLPVTKKAKEDCESDN